MSQYLWGSHWCPWAVPQSFSPSLHLDLAGLQGTEWFPQVFCNQDSRTCSLPSLAGFQRLALPTRSQCRGASHRGLGYF